MITQWSSRKWYDKKEAVDNWPLSLGVEQNGVVTRMLWKDRVMFFGLSWRIVVGDSYEFFQWKAIGRNKLSF
jgi:hypothetical protein